MKTAIVYYSKHHNNTKKLLDAIAALGNVTLIDATVYQNVDLTNFDLVGFASGIYYQTFNKSVMKVAEKCLQSNKKVFFMYTCGLLNQNYPAGIEKIAKDKNARLLGTYGCRGYDTFGPFKLVGGVAKGHPDEADIAGAVSFFQGLIREVSTI
jgi:flavodoxin